MWCQVISPFLALSLSMLPNLYPVSLLCPPCSPSSSLDHMASQHMYVFSDIFPPTPFPLFIFTKQNLYFINIDAHGHKWLVHLYWMTTNFTSALGTFPQTRYSLLSLDGLLPIIWG